MTVSKVIRDGECHLIDREGAHMRTGDCVTSFRGERYMLKGGRAPQHSGSTGKVWVVPVAQSTVGDTMTQEYYPSVFGLSWKRDNDLSAPAEVHGYPVIMSSHTPASGGLREGWTIMVHRRQRGDYVTAWLGRGDRSWWLGHYWDDEGDAVVDFHERAVRDRRQRQAAAHTGLADAMRLAARG